MNLFTPNTDGIFKIPEREYRLAPGISHTQMKHMDPPARQPVYLSTMADPDNERSWACVLGVMVHQRMLEPTKPLPELAVEPLLDSRGKPWEYRTNENKAWRDEHLAAGRFVVSQDDLKQIEDIVDSILSNEAAAQYFRDCQCELSAFSTTFIDGHPVLRKARPDIVSGEFSAIIDIKTTRDGGASEYQWNKTLADRGYWTQGAWHRDVWNEQCDEDSKVEEFIHIVVETAPPYLVKVWPMNERDLKLASRLNRHRAATFSRCQREGVWPGYDQFYTRSSINDYYHNAVEARLNQATT